MRGDIGLGTVIFIAANFGLSFMLIALAFFSPRVGLGIAERAWFVIGFLSTSWALDIPELLSQSESAD